MINKIFWDNDECLVSAYQVFSKNEETDFDVGIKVENDVYNLKINPYAWKMLEFSRKLVGAENVWMITTGTRDYAEAVIEVCGFGFPSNQILTREDIYGMIRHIRFDPEFINPYKNKNNVLIDNLSPRHNELEPFKLIVGAERVVVVVTVIPDDVAEKIKTVADAVKFISEHKK